MFILTTASLTACDAKKPHPDDLPVSYWLNDTDHCIRLSVQAILASGRPYPNDVHDKRHQLIRYDVWIADQLYEMAADDAIFLPQVGAAEKRNPRKYMEVGGVVEHMLKIPKQSFKDPHVSGAMRGVVHCDVGRPPAEWAEARDVVGASRDELIQKLLNQTENRRRVLPSGMLDRPDLKMTEMLSDVEPGVRVGSYVPDAPAMTQVIRGRTVYKAISCAGAHAIRPPYEPDAPMDVMRTCASWVYLGPGIIIHFRVPQQYLPFVPALHDHLIQTLQQSRKK
jgi:hypothetical protein